MKNEGFRLGKGLGRFKLGGKGMGVVIRGEENGWIDCFGGVCVRVGGWVIGVCWSEWIGMVFGIGWVLGGEGVNCWIEGVGDLV